jgi:hypothetical protein
VAQPSRQVVAISSALALALGTLWLVLAAQPDTRVVEAGFWFEPVVHESSTLGRLTRDDMARIESMARDELARAFDGLPIRLSSRGDARYHVRVTQDVRDPRFRRDVNVAGRSRAMAGLGGRGEVSFTFLSSSAIVYAPDGADRDTILDGIGRGIGRAAVHEFTHQLLPSAPLHATRDPGSYEYRSAARARQYYGELHWDLARPLLEARLLR